jgi:outer membrane protein assembly factor BamB
MHKSSRRLVSVLFALGPVCLMSPGVSAIQPQRFEHTHEADFEPGEVENTLVTSLGDVKLATESKAIGEMPEEASIIYDLQQMADGTVYLAAGPQGKLLKREGDAVVEVADLPDEQVFALGEYDGKLLVAISGETSRLAVLEDGELSTLVELEGVRYIWDTLTPPDAMFDGPSIVVATGTEGKVLRVKPGDEAPVTELLDAQQANILCLAMDSQGRILVGTDEDGLVLRLEAGEEDGYRAFAMFDASEPEIGALLVSADGSVYVGTADAEQARPGRLEEAKSEEEGRPEEGGADEDEAQDPDAPGDAPGDMPGEVPGVEPEPEPIDEAVEPSEAQADEAKGGDSADADDVVVADPVAVEQVDAEPTPEQYDRLRELIRDRLSEARKSGQMQAGASLGGGGGGSSSASRSRPVSAPAVEKEGNAVYQIDSQGFVREVFRDTVMILKLVEADGKLLAATGNEGQVFVIDPGTGETAVLVDLSSEQVPAMMLADDGTTLMGTANPAELFTLGNSYALRGTYTSPTLDAAQISLWGAMALTADIPEGCSLTVETRSGNVQEPEQAAWSTAHSLMPDAALPALAPKEVTVQSPPARFLQYRLTLTGTEALTPTVGRVEAAYVTPNLKPVIAKVTAAYPEESEPDAAPATTMNIEWEASDDNQDPLVYKLDYMPAGSDRALVIEEDLTEMTYEWQTRRVPDGRYIVRVTADDRPDNPGDMAMTATRRASPVLVDNSPPELTTTTVINGRQIKISGQAKDAWSAIRSLAYSLDDDDEYHAVLPGDLIFDSTQESWEVTISDLSPGPHVLTLRAADTRGNTVYQSVIFEIK